MKFALLYNLFRARTGLKADKKFKNQLWKKLDSSWQEKYPTKLIWFHQPAFRYATYVLIGLVVVSGGVTSTYAYSSPEVTEGTILYPIKQKMEQIEEITKRTPEAKAEFLIKQVQRREAEKEKMKFKIEQLNAAGKPEKLKRIEKIDEQINLTEDKLEQINERLEKIEIRNPNLKPKIKEILENRAERKLERLHEREEILKVDDNEEIKDVKINREPAKQIIKQQKSDSKITRDWAQKRVNEEEDN